MLRMALMHVHMAGKNRNGACAIDIFDVANSMHACTLQPTHAFRGDESQHALMRETFGACQWGPGRLKGDGVEEPAQHPRAQTGPHTLPAAAGPKVPPS